MVDFNKKSPIASTVSIPVHSPIALLYGNKNHMGNLETFNSHST